MSVTDEIKERLDIVEVIPGYVPLKKSGRNFQGLCPFHNERTPSFVVFPDSQGWHCFGACATGGDVFTFVMKRENLDFGEALQRLAAKAGVELQPRPGPAPAAEQHLDRLRQAVSAAAGYFHYLLAGSPEARIAREYLDRRGLSQSTWETWQLGYAADSWDGLLNHLTRQGYTLGELDQAGLIIRREDSGAQPGGSGHYDRFRGRLMIPIRDIQGRTVGFGARVLREDDQHPQPKYINSPQTPLFDKSNVLYGLDMARQAIRQADLAVIVEGYMDVLMSHQVGVGNVVAGMGTALTPQQLRSLKRYSGNLTLAMDPDTAGDHATLRGLETARAELEREWAPVLGPRGLMRQEDRLRGQIRIATLPDGLDPDELARADVARWRHVIDSALPLVDFYLALVGREEDLASARGKANAVSRLAPLIREIANAVERTHYIQRLARLVQGDERVIAREVEASGTRTDSPRAGRTQAEVARQDAARPGRGADDQDTRRQPRAGAAEAPGNPPSGLSPAASDEEPPFLEEDSGEPPGETGYPVREPAGRPLRRPSEAAPRRALEEHILGHLLARPELMGLLDQEMIRCLAAPMTEEDLHTSDQRAILAALQARPAGDGAWDIEGLLATVPVALHTQCQELASRALAEPSVNDERLVKDVANMVLRLRVKNSYQQANQLHHLIMDHEQAGTRSELRQYYPLMLACHNQALHAQKLLDARSAAGARRKPSGAVALDPPG